MLPGILCREQILFILRFDGPKVAIGTEPKVSCKKGILEAK